MQFENHELYKKYDAANLLIYKLKIIFSNLILIWSFGSVTLNLSTFLDKVYFDYDSNCHIFVINTI